MDVTCGEGTERRTYTLRQSGGEWADRQMEQLRRQAEGQKCAAQAEATDSPAERAALIERTIILAQEAVEVTLRIVGESIVGIKDQTGQPVDLDSLIPATAEPLVNDASATKEECAEVRRRARSIALARSLPGDHLQRLTVALGSNNPNPPTPGAEVPLAGRRQ
jgi:hypothetical protein